MYTEFFGLSEKPFSITPDPRYLYLSRRHADALAHLIYGISESGGFIQLTGEVGTGKTTLIRSLLEQLPAKAEIALILNPQLSALEFLQAICDELCVPTPKNGSRKARIDSLNAQLFKVHAEGRRVVLIVDEAQTLSPELLEQVRLLTNLETAKHKLLQIILIGQPELRDVLDRMHMRQIAQRVTGRYHLEPLSADDTAAYVRHRMKVAGSHSDVFARSAIRQLYRKSRGIPRLINVLADRALLAAYTHDQRKIDGKLVRRAAAEVFGDRRPGGRWWPWAAVGVGIASFALATTNLWQDLNEQALELPAATTLAALDLPDADPTPAMPAPAPAPTTLTLAELVATPGFSTGPDDAIGQLLALWGGDYDAARGDPCEQAQEQGLACLFQQRGSISELRQMNRPAILSLVDAHGQSLEVVITELGYDEAQLISNDKTFEIPLAELTYYWYGDHLLVWRPGMRELRALTPGMRDPGVLWLRETVARIRGESPPNDPSELYDAALATQVREYQRERMLTVDGIVGARTQIIMTTELEMPPTPRLLASSH